MIELLGKPYKNLARGPDSFDCWGLVYYIYKKYLNIELPDYKNYEHKWYKNGKDVLNQQITKFNDLWHEVKLSQANRYDILTFTHGKNGIVNHCGLYLENKKFIHCYTKCPVVIDRLTRPYWNNRLNSIMRYHGHTN